MMLETLASFREPQEAHMLRCRLAAEGVFAVVDYRFHVGNNWIWSNGLGGVKVRVLREQLADAQFIERAARQGTFRLNLQTEFGDLDDLCCPVCQSTDFSKRRPAYQAILTAVLFFFGGYIPPWYWICLCNTCSASFRTTYGLIGKSPFSEFNFRFAEVKVDDATEMSRLRDAGWSTQNSTENPLIDHVTALPSGARVWLCHLDGLLTGVGIAEPSARHIEILVDPDFERNGIGKKLYKLAVEWLFELSKEPIWAKAMPLSKGQKFLYAAGWKLADIEDDDRLRFDLEYERWQKFRLKF